MDKSEINGGKNSGVQVSNYILWTADNMLRSPTTVFF